ELLDAGYRATDPSSRIRYTVSKAPLDAPLTSGMAGSNGAERQPAAAPVREVSRRPEPAAAAPAPAATTGSAAPAPAANAAPIASASTAAAARAPKPSV